MAVRKNKNYYLFLLFLNLVLLFFVFESQNLKVVVSQKMHEKLEIKEELTSHISELESQHREYERILFGVGGSTSYPVELYDSDFVFPISERDFLRYTSPFGYRRDPFIGVLSFHRGLDIATIWRAEVVSVSDGIVVESWPPPGAVGRNGVRFTGHPIYGGMLLIDHGDFQTMYAHLSSTFVVQGSRVQAGQVIGRVGDTGRSLGQHLHFEMFVNGENVNPLLYFSELEYFQ